MNPIRTTSVSCLVSVVILAGAWLGAGVALADEQSPKRSVTLSLTTHALDTAQGVRLTYARIRNASRAVCGYADRVFRQERDAWDACVDAATRDAVRQIGDERLTELYLAKSRAERGHPVERSLVQLRQR